MMHLFRSEYFYEVLLVLGATFARWCILYLMPRSLARLSWRSMMLCRISSTSCLSSLSSISEMEKSGSRKEGGKAAAMDLDLKPEVT